MRHALRLLFFAVLLASCDSGAPEETGPSTSDFSVTVRVEDADGAPQPGLSVLLETRYEDAALMEPPIHGFESKGGGVFLLNSYPSPFQDEVQIGVGTSEAIDLEFSLLRGETVVASVPQTTVSTGSYRYTLDVRDLPSGVYRLTGYAGEEELDRWVLKTDGDLGRDGVARDLGQTGANGTVTTTEREAAPGVFNAQRSFPLYDENNTSLGTVRLSRDAWVFVTDGDRTVVASLALFNGPNEVTVVW